MFVTALVSNIDTSRDVKELQFSNIQLISVTPLVLKLLDNVSDVNPLQPANILCVYARLDEVLKFDRSKDVILLQFKNISDVVVAAAPLKLLDKVRLVKLAQS